MNEQQLEKEGVGEGGRRRGQGGRLECLGEIGAPGPRRGPTRGPGPPALAPLGGPLARLEEEMPDLSLIRLWRSDSMQGAD